MPDQEVTPEVRTAEARKIQPAQPAGRGRSETRARHENTCGRRAREQAGDPIERGEAVARSITPFEVDTHGSRMSEYELVLIQRHYHVPDYV